MKPKLEAVSWDDIANKVNMVNPRLFEIIDRIMPNKKLFFIKATYPFGILNFSTDAEAIDYNSTPIALVLKNNLEAFIEAENRFVPYRIFRPGDTFAPFDIETSALSFAAGARSLFLLPKVSDSFCHNRLQVKYKVSPITPKSLPEQHAVFTALAQHKNFVESWSNEVLFFSNKWMLEEQFVNFLLQDDKEQSLNWQQQLQIELLWQAFAEELDSKNIKPRQYLVDTVRQLIAIGMGRAPAFAPASDSSFLPLVGLQKIYIGDYGLKNHVPTFMEPRYVNDSVHDGAVYYSFQYPSLLAYAPGFKNIRSVLQDVENVEFLMRTLYNKLKREKPNLYTLIADINFEYFHPDADSSSNISSTENLDKQDLALTKMYSGDKRKDLKFAANASFLRGCVRITKSK